MKCLLFWHLDFILLYCDHHELDLIFGLYLIHLINSSKTASNRQRIRPSAGKTVRTSSVAYGLWNKPITREFQMNWIQQQVTLLCKEIIVRS